MDKMYIFTDWHVELCTPFKIGCGLNFGGKKLSGLE